MNRVELRNISKSFGGITALDNVNLTVRKGEIHALVGENGAGKSTLMKILSGAYYKNAGTLSIDGKEVQIRNTHDSKALGIGIIYQEFSLVPELSVAENIFLGDLGEGSSWIRWQKMNDAAKDLIESLDFHISPTAKVKQLSIAQQQVVEIAKALTKEVKVLILDEPSAVLGPREIKKLFDTLRNLRAKGVSIIYISHRLEEVFALADRITILKNGRSSESLEVKGTTSDEIIRLMLGRPLEALFPNRDAIIGKELLRVKNLKIDNRIKDISLSVRAGEVVGIAGLVGSGRTETLQGIFGVRKRLKGQISLSDIEMNIKSPRQAVRAGMGMVPEDRKKEGLITSLPIKENISLTNLASVSGKLGFIYRKDEREKVNTLMEQLKIKARDENAKAFTLSGGNQQKVVMAKWLNRDCRILLIDEPTRGVDVGAKVEIYKQMNRVAAQGVGILVVSSEIAELLGICDRIMVMHEGKMQGELSKEQFSEENVLRLAMGERLKG